MLLSLICYLICRALSAGHGLADDRDVELPVLRHQLRVLRRQVRRPCLRRSDRLIPAAASRRWSSPPSSYARRCSLRRLVLALHAVDDVGDGRGRAFD
jgi:hypothetical protein